jgi:general secretion pathway protein D
VLADPRTNSLIVRAPSAGARQPGQVADRQARPADPELGNVHVVYLKNADATKLAQTLRAVVSQDASAVPTQQQGTGRSIQNGNGGTGGGSGSSAASRASRAATRQRAAPSNPLAERAGQRQAAPAAARAGFIQADASTNSLIITAPESPSTATCAPSSTSSTCAAPRSISRRWWSSHLDKASEFGVQWVGLTGDANSKYRVGGLQSFTTGGTNNIATWPRSRPAIGSAPAHDRDLPSNRPVDRHLQADQRRAGPGRAGALAGIGRQRQHPVDAEHDHARQRTGHHQGRPERADHDRPVHHHLQRRNNNPFQTIDRKDVGLLLKVRPQISEGGTIKMAIYHENSASTNRRDGAAGITLTNRAIETTCWPTTARSSCWAA